MFKIHYTNHALKNSSFSLATVEAQRTRWGIVIYIVVP